ncbi:DUF4279 domain-containing protein [Nonomuraea sp. NPDC049725]|uniref:DUF4279 domain-containing protein n=1 Tax=Nonomuraea sp. NPDC049725 TaxID=3154508 RepID=UPI003421F09F
MPAAEMTARLAFEPDRITVMGSKLPDPPYPAVHVWRVDGPPRSSLPLDDMILTLVERLHPYAAAIGDLAAELNRHEPENLATLQAVRFFTDEAPAADTPDRPLGWHLDRHVLDFLRTTRAELDVDEYGHDL